MMPGLQALHAAVGTAAVAVGLAIIAAGALQNLLYLVQFTISFVALRARPPVPDRREVWLQLSDSTIPISLLVPAFNEQATVVENIRSLLALTYPNFEIIVINDGSTDRTLGEMIGAFDLRPAARAFEEAVPHRPIRNIYRSSRHPQLMVVDKENGGKADALNAGINLARMPLVCAMDADSLLENDSLLRAVQPFADDPIQVLAVGGTIRVVNGCTVRAGQVVEVGLPGEPLALFQIVEYLRAFLMARLAWSRLNALMVISGAFGIFKRSAVVAVGGYSLGTVGEDIDLIVKIHRLIHERGINGEVRFVADPVCWTEVPVTLRQLGRQRRRWQRGALETFFTHFRMLGNPRYGAAGLVGFPYLFLADVLGPPLEVLGYLLIPLLWGTGLLGVEYLLAFLALTFVFGVCVSVGALILEELQLHRYPRPRDLALLTLVAVAENFGYRQINNLWRIAGYWQFLRGAKGWGLMERRGFGKGEGRRLP
ncbi:glycosyltransferase family 2 protein [Shumkonia mesophila]|uniref:glycosyltransferase family 2 protein n=1 Tax=Shumkonia mesophila TaxID=2838854 RepID=UPI0029346DCA|nr:glycosyltransferase [Shumkonia mesophila]